MSQCHDNYVATEEKVAIVSLEAVGPDQCHDDYAETADYGETAETAEPDGPDDKSVSAAR